MKDDTLAFPSEVPSFAERDDILGYHQGMTLRDYFAAKAMGGLLATFPAGQQKDIVKVAYDIADAMLEERNRNDPY